MSPREYFRALRLLPSQARWLVNVDVLAELVVCSPGADLRPQKALQLNAVSQGFVVDVGITLSSALCF